MSTFIDEITLLEARLAEVDGHLRTMGSMLDIAMDGVDKRDVLIAELRGRIARLEQEAEGYFQANQSLFEDKARLIRQVTVLQADLAEERGR